jgi:hypothetical protein
MLYLCAQRIHFWIPMNQNDNTQYPMDQDPPNEEVSAQLSDKLLWQ